MKASRALDQRRPGGGRVTPRNLGWTRRRILACVLALTLGLASWASANEPLVDMTEVRRLARAVLAP